MRLLDFSVRGCTQWRTRLIRHIPDLWVGLSSSAMTGDEEYLDSAFVVCRMSCREDEKKCG